MARHYSWEIPFSFLAFQWAGIIYIYHRNQYIDRAAIWLVSTLAVQEIFQTVVWMFGITADTTASHCNLFNTLMSHCIMILLFAFPVIQLLFAYKTSFYNDLFRRDSVRKVIVKIAIAIYCIWYVASIALRIHSEVQSAQPICIFVGENGYQDWSTMLMAYPLTEHSAVWMFIVYAMNAMFFVPNIALLALYSPLWVIVCHASCTLGSFVVLYVLYGMEAFSMWILISLFNFVWILLSPHIANCMVDSGFVSFHNPSKFLYGSYGHLVQHNMLKSEFTDDERDEYDYERDLINEEEKERMLQ